jgi:hypothetical protein
MEILLPIRQSFPPAARYAAIMAEKGIATRRELRARPQAHRPKKEKFPADGFASGALSSPIRKC